MDTDIILLAPKSERFYQKYAHLRLPTKDGGIQGVGVGVPKNEALLGIIVYIKSSQEVMNELPTSFEGTPVYKIMIGSVSAS